jgi:hypothetical protein
LQVFWAIVIFAPVIHPTLLVLSLVSTSEARAKPSKAPCYAQMPILWVGFHVYVRLTWKKLARDKPGNTKWGSINVLLTSCLIGLELAA